MTKRKRPGQMDFDNYEPPRLGPSELPSLAEARAMRPKVAVGATVVNDRIRTCAACGHVREVRERPEFAGHRLCAECSQNPHVPPPWPREWAR